MKGRRQVTRVVVQACQFHPVPMLAGIQPRDLLKAGNDLRRADLPFGSRIERQCGDSTALGRAFYVRSPLARRIAARAQFVQDGERADLVAGVVACQGDDTFRRRHDVLYGFSENRDLLGVGSIARRKGRDELFLRVGQFCRSLASCRLQALNLSPQRAHFRIGRAQRRLLGRGRGIQCRRHFCASIRDACLLGHEAGRQVEQDSQRNACAEPQATTTPGDIGHPDCQTLQLGLHE